MIQSTEIEQKLQAQDLEIGAEFWEIYQGYTATGRGQVSRIWKIAAYLGNGIYSCGLLSDNTVRSINPDYRENFHERKIRSLLKETPILNAVK